MLEILQFYVSGFWAWLGITIGLYVCAYMLLVIATVFRGGDK
jgi:hypothetical protein|tara:strand:+ start:163 stop:288 length:126 start_codon:yes stop_codon:yes gene_type:complete